LIEILILVVLDIEKILKNILIQGLRNKVFSIEKLIQKINLRY